MGEPYWADETVTLYLGKCEEVLPGLPANSVDAIVTDPPYDLTAGKKGGTGEASLNVNSPAGRSRISTGGGGFMGKSWDATGVAFKAETWQAVMRVMKPGAYLLAFGGARTWHRMVCAIEDAGFEIRDPIADLTGMDAPGLLWIQGQGYPKSRNVSKDIDKRAEENMDTKRRVIAVAEVIRSHREAMGMTSQQVSMAVVGTPSGACWNWEHQQLPSVEMWPAIKAALGITDKYDALIKGDRAQFIAAEREVIGQRKTGIGTGRGDVAYIGDSENRDVTAPATEAAARWEGWGTALKPAWEPVAVARKPFKGSVAQNVLTHGTGAFNLAACKVAHAGEADEVEYRRNASGDRGHDESRARAMDFGMTAGHASDDGRWPPNLVTGEVAAAELDRQSGVSVSRSGGLSTKALGVMNDDVWQARDVPRTGHDDTGGASRFFPVFRYEPKAPSSERPRLPDGTAWPTVKPLDFIRWLVRLVTPPGGVVLDPFCGTATTAEACIIEGFRCITIDRDPVALQLAMERLSKPIQPTLFGLGEAG